MCVVPHIRARVVGYSLILGVASRSTVGRVGESCTALEPRAIHNISASVRMETIRGEKEWRARLVYFTLHRNEVES